MCVYHMKCRPLIRLESWKVVTFEPSNFPTFELSNALPLSQDSALAGITSFYFSCWLKVPGRLGILVPIFGDRLPILTQDCGYASRVGRDYQTSKLGPIGYSFSRVATL